MISPKLISLVLIKSTKTAALFLTGVSFSAGIIDISILALEIHFKKKKLFFPLRCLIPEVSYF